MNKTISQIFEEAKVRLTPTVLNKVKDGKKYKRGKVLAKNGKLAECLIIDDNNEVEAIIEFLRNYIKVGELKRITEIKIEEYIKLIRRNNKKQNDETIQEALDIKDSNEDKLLEENSKIENCDVVDNYKVNTLKEQGDDLKKVNEYSKIVNLIAPDKAVWNAYSNAKKDEIFNILYENKYILEMVLEKMLE